ncbi:hypothetical protein KIN20_025905, partial [Parelaphostrongylus tenuis]
MKLAVEPWWSKCLEEVELALTISPNWNGINPSTCSVPIVSTLSSLSVINRGHHTLRIKKSMPNYLHPAYGGTITVVKIDHRQYDFFDFTSYSFILSQAFFWTLEKSALADHGYHIGMFLRADYVRGCSGVF